MRLRRRMFLGVTSISSSSAMYSIASSRLKRMGGTSRSASSAPEERMDRLPLGFCDIEFYNEPADYGLFLPDALPPEFTAAEFASAAHVTPMIAGMTVNLLLRTGHIAPGGKRGRALLYRKI